MIRLLFLVYCDFRNVQVERQHLQIVHILSAAVLFFRTPKTDQTRKICKLDKHKNIKWNLSVDDKKNFAAFVKTNGGWSDSVNTFYSFIDNLTKSNYNFPLYFFQCENRYQYNVSNKYTYTSILLRKSKLPIWTVKNVGLHRNTLAQTDYHRREIVFNIYNTFTIQSIYITAAHEMAHALRYGSRQGITSGFRNMALKLGDPKPRPCAIDANVL